MSRPIPPRKPCKSHKPIPEPDPEYIAKLSLKISRLLDGEQEKHALFALLLNAEFILERWLEKQEGILPELLQTLHDSIQPLTSGINVIFDDDENTRGEA